MSVQNFKIKHGLNLGDHELIDVSGNINLPVGAVIQVDGEPLDALPDQTNQTGKFLFTDGSSASWNAITQYTPPTNQGGGNFLSGDGTYKQVTVPTLVSQLSNDSGYQTGAEVAASVAALVDTAPSTLNTLNELAQALGDDPNFATTVTNQIGTKQNVLVSGTNIKTVNGNSLLGSGDISITGYTDADVLNYLTLHQYATFDNVNQGLASRAALAGATFTGTVQAPTFSSEVKAAASKQGMQWTDSSGTKLFGLSVYGGADTYSPSLVWNSGNPTANYTGGSSVVIGAWAAPLGSGFSNAIFGYGAGYGLTSGGQNAFFGTSAGYSNAGTANQTTLIGTNTTPAAANQTNQTVIGYGAIGNGSNTVTIGNASITDTYLKGIIHGDGSGLTSLPSDATKANQSTTYTKTETDTALALKANQSTTYTKTEIDTIAATKLNKSGDTMTGQLNMAGAIIPTTNASYDLGSSTLAWRNVYTNDLHLSNEGHEEGNSVDGTKGNWTIQEGATDLFIINNKTGKKYKFALEEIQ